ncbi:MAG: hypothetical protein ACSLEM_00855 [Candidatus Malihini olakiniferum]
MSIGLISANIIMGDDLFHYADLRFTFLVTDCYISYFCFYLLCAWYISVRGALDYPALISASKCVRLVQALVAAAMMFFLNLSLRNFWGPLSPRGMVLRPLSYLVTLFAV